MNYFLDANIFVRHIAKDHKVLSPKAKMIFEKVATKEVRVSVTTLVLHEAIYVLEHIYKVGRKNIVENIVKPIALEGFRILDLDKMRVLAALDDFVNTKLDFADCVYKQVALENKLKILSFDRDFSKLKVKRLETVWM
ncbi:hypothetical protein A2630_02405 [Candidatus Woesebacteria bacterium RIFCSPHIGHO2_01_FULL_44_10]|uniref:PIN domain-containing protein n=1 Tax=Candidatus Woesebacteria bacterium RIFCSPLOWO2_01_FULL_44_14 TaxID=1802525 RepID=A0A1F8C292_9BACT|nr:MAG: hypothetical protein A2630_02405 [Candidatus Woesebacteria bacterium RIFCSPHIGHO2_01_FULL_44_10]OGM53982.1 MAG: hypothetical protein A3F62_00230 [Candidatus Woesebacteria bacterium RIFCSPHIGHO2_12_FULL_44_11]OGM69949.1 MAG: hypothetical protein A2975_05065 [Candidatus Woesebacteria bacterium RIFCSPLOWO2_01_FULL_44_14]